MVDCLSFLFLSFPVQVRIFLEQKRFAQGKKRRERDTKQ